MPADDSADEAVAVTSGGGGGGGGGAVTIDGQPIDVTVVGTDVDALHVIVDSGGGGGGGDVNILSQSVPLDVSAATVPVLVDPTDAIHVIVDSSATLGVDIFAETGGPFPVTISDGSGPVTVDGTVVVTDGGGSITVDGSVTISDGSGPVTVDGTVAITGSVAVTSTTLGVTAITLASSATSLGKAEDDPAASGDIGVAALFVRSQGPSLSRTDTDGDYINPVTDNRGVVRTIGGPDIFGILVASAGLTIATTAYSIGDQLGNVMTLSGAAWANGQGNGILRSVQCTDYSKVTGAIDLWFFSFSPSGLGGNNVAMGFTDTTTVIGVVHMPAGDNTANSNTKYQSNINMPYSLGAAASDLFCVAVTQTANAIFTAATDLKFTFNVSRV